MNANTSRITQIKQAFQPKHALPAITAGIVIVIINAFIEISLAVMFFSGELSAFIPRGIGFALFGAVAISFVTMLTSSFPGVVAIPQDTPAAILVLTISAITAQMIAAAASMESIFSTVVMTMMLTTFLTGLLFLLLGRFKLGGLVRYLPYPVFGGFLAGTGWLLVQGGLGMLIDVSLPLAQLPTLFQPATLLMWAPGFLFAGLLIIMMRRHSHFLILPGALLAAIGLFYLILWLTQTSITAAAAQGLLLGDFPSGQLWQPLSLSALGQIDWRVILGQAGNIGTMMLISLISLLLNASSLEVIAQEEIDLNRELKASGLANCIAGLGGSTPGYHTLSLSALGVRLGANSRWIGLTVAVIQGVIILFGASLLSYLPTPVLSGLIIFIGLGFLVEWLYDGWKKLTKIDYVMVCLIMIVMNVVGVLQGVGLGLLVAVVLFVIDYSRISVVKHTLSRATYRSAVIRPRLFQQLLKQKGEWVYILKLQGFIFFGTANKLFEQIRDRLDAPEQLKPHFIVLDMQHVLGLDASAELTLVKLKQLAQAQEMTLVFTHLGATIRRRLEKNVFAEAAGGSWRAFDDLDHGVEWCEEQMLQAFAEVGFSAHPQSIKKQFEAFLPKSPRLISLFERLEQEEDAAPAVSVNAEPSVAQMLTYMERQDVPAGYRLIQKGDKPRGLYFIESGRVTLQLEHPDGRVARVQTMRAGTIVGEIGLYLGFQATTTAIADEPCTLYYLSANNLKRMENEAPALAAAFHKFVAQHLSERLAETTEVLQALSN